MRGRAKATGRHKTREELVAAVWRNWLYTKMNQVDIARANRVSVGVVNKILNTKEGYQHESRNPG